jgi:hypothetical protein
MIGTDAVDEILPVCRGIRGAIRSLELSRAALTAIQVGRPQLTGSTSFGVHISHLPSYW